MTPHSAETQLTSLMGWFKAKANNEEAFSIDGAASFLAGMRQLKTEITALRQIAEGFNAQARELNALRIRCKCLELENEELKNPLVVVDCTSLATEIEVVS